MHEMSWRSTSMTWMALAALLAGACGPQSGDGDGGGSQGSSGAHASSSGPDGATTAGADTTSTSGGEALPDGCVCRDVDPEQALTCEDVARSECVGEPICDTITVRCPRASSDMYACAVEYEYAEEALTCSLVALRDRSQGKLAVDAVNDICGLEGCGSDEYEIALVGDDRAVRVTCSASPIGPEGSTSRIVALADPSHFDGCLALESPADRYDCMLDGLDPGAEICSS
jgi:hypothetical protein